MARNNDDDVSKLYFNTVLKIRKEYHDLSFSDISKYIEDAYSNVINIKEISDKKDVNKFYKYKRLLKLEVLMMKGKFEEFKDFYCEKIDKFNKDYLYEWSIVYSNPNFVKFFTSEIMIKEKEENERLVRQNRQHYISDNLSYEKTEYIETACAEGNLEMVKLLLKEFKIDLSKLPIEDQYYFLEASFQVNSVKSIILKFNKEPFCKENDLKITKYFIENGLDPLVRNQKLFTTICDRCLFNKEKKFNYIHFLVKYTRDRGEKLNVRGLLNTINSNNNDKLAEYLVKLYDEYFI